MSTFHLSTNSLQEPEQLQKSEFWERIVQVERTTGSFLIDDKIDALKLKHSSNHMWDFISKCFTIKTFCHASLHKL